MRTQDVEQDHKSTLEKHPLEHYTLLQPLRSPILRRHFLSLLFNTELDLTIFQSTDNGFAAFFDRYEFFCGLAMNKQHAVSSISHLTLCQIKDLIGPSVPYSSLLVKLQGEDDGFAFPSQVATVVIDLVASVWLMLTIGSFPGNITYHEPQLWDSGSLFVRSLEEVPDKHAVRTRRKECVTVANRTFSPKFAPDDYAKLPQSFTAEYLEKIAGINVRWTNNLADHLLLTDDDTKLLFFHHVSALELHMQSPSSCYPWDLMDETMRTVSLLLPPALGQPNAWFLREAKNHSIDINAGFCKRLNSAERSIDEFRYWRQRLVILKRTFDEAEPKTVRQLWYDDRKKTQWFTFWVAVLVFVMTVFFGVIQSVGTWVQAWASVVALNHGSDTVTVTVTSTSFPTG